MKKYVSEFIKRGLMAAVGGPVVLAIVYGILGATNTVTSLTPQSVCLGILTISLMAFVAAGITVVYTAEKLPLFWAALLHGMVLYADYILIYSLNGWLKSGLMPIVIFTVIFIAGYALIWGIIYFSTRRAARSLNKQIAG